MLGHPLQQVVVVLNSASAYVLSLEPHDTIGTLKRKLKHNLGNFSGILEFDSCWEVPGVNGYVSTYENPVSCLVSMRISLDSAAFQKLFDLSWLDMDDSFNRDFTTVTDDGPVRMRGGEKYERPLGWFRFGMNLQDKYGSYEWLGDSRKGMEQSQQEWPVSYRGIKKRQITHIVQSGYSLDLLGGAPGEGIYTTPKIEVAESYAEKFIHGGRVYKAVIQNRVSPNFLKQSCVSFVGGGVRRLEPFWVSEVEDDVRPYGVLVKQVPDKGDSINIGALGAQTRLVPVRYY